MFSATGQCDAGYMFSVFTNLVYGRLVGVIECGIEPLQGSSVRIEVNSDTNLIGVFCTTKCALSYKKFILNL